MAFPRINGRTTIVTVLTATTAATLSLRVCVCLRISSQPLHKTTAAGTFQNVYVPKQFGTGTPCVICQDTPHNATFPGQAAEDREERRVPTTDRRPDSACTVLPHRGSSQSECGLPLSMWCCVPFCHTPCHKSVGRAITATRWAASRATPSSCWMTTMTAASEVCLQVISQDTSLETVLWIHLLLRTLSWCVVSPQLLDGNDGGDWTHVAPGCVYCCYFRYNQAISSLWLLGGNGDVGEIVTLTSDFSATSVLVSSKPLLFSLPMERFFTDDSLASTARRGRLPRCREAQRDNQAGDGAVATCPEEETRWEAKSGRPVHTGPV